MLKVDIQAIKYFSEFDEDSFFLWVKRIECIESVDNGFLQISIEKVNEVSLRELLALFSRYQLSAKPLASLCTNENKFWFNNPKSFWYKSVFADE